VLDEADRMLDMGFKAQLDRILKVLPRRRQTMLCSATMGQEVSAYSDRWLNDPVRIEVVRSGTVAAKATQRVFHLPESSKTGLLLALLAQNEASTLVFTRTKHRANRVTQHLDRAGFSVGRIHGNRSQSQRTAALDGFRQGKFRVLVATDVAARGIDVEDIAHVVNFDLSLVADDHVHRVGRTARAEASGLASSFCSPEEVHLLRQIERATRREIPRAELPAGVPTQAAPSARVPAHAGGRAPARAPSRRPAATPVRHGSDRNAPRGSRSTGGHAGGHSRGRRGRSSAR
jgi:ATP-dependent RNA helicase RhlE